MKLERSATARAAACSSIWNSAPSARERGDPVRREVDDQIDVVRLPWNAVDRTGVRPAQVVRDVEILQGVEDPEGGTECLGVDGRHRLPAGRRGP